MYDIKVLHELNSAPWEMKLQDRCRYMNEMIRSGYRISVIVYEYPDTSTFRYRGYNIYQAMQNSEQWKVVYFYRHELMYVKNFLPHIDVVTVVRVKWNHELQMFMDEVKKRHIPLLFDVDDRIYDTDYLPLVTNTLDVDFETDAERSYDFWFSYISRIEMTAKCADAYIGTNPYLCSTLHDKFGKKEYVIPNFLNDEQVEISRMCLEEKSKKQSEQPFVIGYFSGTPSHINDFKIIYKEMIQLLEEFEDMVLQVVGFMEFPEELKPWIDSGRVRFTGLVDFIQLQRLVASVDVNIVPLVVNEFTNCKSELKFFEAAVVNTVTCASRSYTYERAIEHAKTGFLCSPTQWYTTIKDIYLGKYDIQKICRQAYAYAMKHYYGTEVVKGIEEVYNQVVEEFSCDEK